MIKKILIVDDSRTSRLFIQQALEIAGFTDATFLQAGNGHEALSQIQSQGPIEMMVTDINMPGKGGLELIQDLRAQRSMKELAIVVISSTQCRARDLTLKELGVAAVLEKPINMQKMIAAFGPFKKGA